jgi:hypothetical protein
MVEMHLAWPVTHVGQYLGAGRRRDRPGAACDVRHRAHGGPLADGESAAAALNGGYDLTYLVGVAFSLIAMAVALYVLRLRARARDGARARRAGRPPAAYREA